VSLFCRPGVLLLACDFKTDRFQAFVGAFSRYLGERVAEYDARGEVENGRRAISVVHISCFSLLAYCTPLHNFRYAIQVHVGIKRVCANDCCAMHKVSSK
jgi:hypothetical protein